MISQKVVELAIPSQEAGQDADTEALVASTARLTELLRLINRLVRAAHMECCALIGLLPF